MIVQAENGKKKMANGTGKVSVVCLHCEKPFDAYACHVNVGRAKFCSVGCKNEHHHTTGSEIRVCRGCGESFSVTKSSLNQYCSSKCAGIQRRTKINTNCLNCGVTFSVFPAKVAEDKGKCCSRKCWDTYKKKTQVVKKCKECGNDFSLYPSRAKAQFCSNDCKRLWTHKHSVYEITKNCEYCGNGFKPTPKRRNSRFCSKECGHSFQAESYIGKNVGDLSPVYSRVEKTCPNCGNGFTVKKSQHERVSDNCCSKACAVEWLIESGKLAGENNASWLGGISALPYAPIWIDKRFKAGIRERDNHTCQNPDCRKNGDYLVIHHISYDKKDCEPTNLITLCNSCNGRANFNRGFWQAGYSEIIRLKYESIQSDRQIRQAIAV
jgi:hypothetical protein